MEADTLDRHFGDVLYVVHIKASDSQTNTPKHSYTHNDNDNDGETE